MGEKREVPANREGHEPPRLPNAEGSPGGPGLLRSHFEDLFRFLYVQGNWYRNVEGKAAARIFFAGQNFDHAFFKAGSEGEGRNVWQPDRAELMLWIGHTVEHGEVRLQGPRDVMFMSKCRGKKPWYRVVTTRRVNGDLQFVTAYAISEREYLESCKTSCRVLKARK